MSGSSPSPILAGADEPRFEAWFLRTSERSCDADAPIYLDLGIVQMPGNVRVLKRRIALEDYPADAWIGYSSAEIAWESPEVVQYVFYLDGEERGRDARLELFRLTYAWDEQRKLFREATSKR